MCNCNKARAAARPRAYSSTAATGASGTATQSFSLIIDGKTTESFGSRLEADAANARAGYRGVVRQNNG